MTVTWPEHFHARLMGRALGSSGLSSFAIALEAWRRGLEVTFVANDLHVYTISDGQRTVRFNFSRPDSITSRDDYTRLDRKSEATALLREERIPAPRGFLLDSRTTSEESLRELAEELGFPLVLKPNTGSMGQGVLTGLSNWQELKSGYDYLVSEIKARQIVVEKHQEGDDYRVLVVDGRVIGAVRRVPANVTGNGLSSVSVLIDEKNISRKWNPFLTSGLIKIDYEVTKCLEAQNLGLDDVPDKGVHVTLRRVANASAGGDVIDVTDELPDEIKDAAVRAVKIFPRVLIAGVDVLYKTGQPATPDNYVIIEINSRPQIGVNMYPSLGRGRDVPLAIIDTHFPETKRSDSELIKSIRFNERAIRVAIRSGVASKVALPILPKHLYPYRSKLRYEAQGATVSLGPYAGRTLQKIARLQGVAGSVSFTKSGDIELIVAAENRVAAQSVVDKVSRLSALDPSSEDPWRGPVTVGFIITQ